MNQTLFAYQLSHEDGSKSRWVFVNDGDFQGIDISITLQNGATYSTIKTYKSLAHWAQDRGLSLTRAVYHFNSETMKVTLI